MAQRHSHAVIVGRFLPPHLGHEALAARALEGSDTLTIVVAAGPLDPIPGALRAAWLQELSPGARVVVGAFELPAEGADAGSWQQAAASVRALVGDSVDALYGSADGARECARSLGVAFVQHEPGGTTAHVPSGRIREDPAAHWQLLAPGARAHLVRRVCVVGAESTGTTTMARALAEHYDTLWVPEYGREFTYRKLEREGEGAPWRSEEFVEIAVRQCELEDEAARTCGPVLLCDTDALATAIWHERYMGSQSSEVLRLAATRSYDLSLLTCDDVPFEADEIRDGEHLRGWMTDRFREVLAQRGEPVVELHGPHEQRLRVAIAAIDALLARGWQLGAMPGVGAHGSV